MPLDPHLLALLDGDIPQPAPRPVVEGVTVTDEAFDGPHGSIPVRIYRAGTGGPGFVWSHGGGWVGGDLDMPEADATSRRIAKGIEGVVVSVDYRLAPTHVFPVPADDVVAAFEATAGRAAELAIDPSRIGLGGASAGGHLSALAAARTTPTPKAVVLVYPAVDPPAGRTSSARTTAGAGGGSTGTRRSACSPRCSALIATPSTRRPSRSPPSRRGVATSHRR
jgi:acetyl esterase/lipase